MKLFTRLMLLMLLSNYLIISKAQTVISNESFPNSFNTGFTKPINSTFTGSIGSWGAFSNNSSSTVVVNSAYFQSSPNALKLVNYETSKASSVSSCVATSPTLNCNPACATAVSLNFRLFTFCVVSSNTSFSFFVEVSKDNGSTWTTLYTRTAQQLFSAFGQGTWNTVSVAIPSTTYSSTFKYRFRGVQQTKCSSNNYLYIDDACIIATPCATNLKLGNLVWLDNNGNNTKDASEPGIANVSVRLYADVNNDNTVDGAALATTTTDANGNYSFNGLAAGNYIVGVVIPTGFTRGPNTTTDPDNNTDNDNNAVNQIGASTAGGEMRSLAISLSAGNEPTTDGDDNNGNLTLDLALCPVPTCSGRVTSLYFNKLDGGADISISNGSIFSLTQLGSLYNLEAGTSGTVGSVRFTISGPTASSNIENTTPYNIPATGSGAWTGTSGNYSVNIKVYSSSNAGGTLCHDTTISFVIVTPTLSLGNLVWLDSNGNNTKDASEPGIANATVRLYADANNDNTVDGAAFATTTTDANGNYSFIGLNPGNYIVGVIIPTGLTKGANSSSDPDNNVDNDNNAVNQIGVSTAGGEMRSLAITLAAGTEPTTDGDDNNGNQTLDLALCPAPNNLVLGNLVWVDTNGDGFKGTTEVGLGGVTVKLYRDNNADSIPDGAAIATTTTSSAGIYSFGGLAAGKYIVGVTIPTGYIAVPFNDTTADDNIDNDNNGFAELNGEFFSNFITLSQGDEPTNDGDDANGNLTLDFALQLKVNTPPGGCPNGTFGEGFETGTFSTGGSDLFHGLPRNGSYQIVNNINQLGGGGYLNIQPRTGNYFLAAHTSNNPVDRVWYANIPVIPGKTYNFCTAVTLLKNLGNGANYILGLYANGQLLDTGRVTFSWTSICGSYTVPTGVTSIELSIRDPKKGLFFVAIDDICITEVPANLSLGNLVWLDLNANNANEAFEPVIPNATVKLYVDANNDNIADGAAIRTTITNSNGQYTFSNLTAGNYIVGVTIPPSYQARLNGSIDPDNDVDNDNNGVILVGANQPGSEVRSNAITLLQGTEPTNDGDDNNGNLSLDFGMCPLATNLVLGNLVWNDFDGDGRKDSNEPGIGGVTVSIYRDDNGDNLKDTDAPFATTTTNSQGAYRFSNLAPGRYIISIPVLPGYSPSPNSSTQATSPFPDNDVDNDNNGVNVIAGVVFTNAITLLPGTEPTADGDDANGNLTFDIAVCGNAFIGDFVWNDLNGNGIQEVNEPGINGATVNLTFSDGTVATTTTINFNGKDGYYDFKNLGPDTYVVSFVTPAGLTPSPANQGSDDALDSDPVNGSVSVTLLANVSNFTIDAGFYNASVVNVLKLGNFVWNDFDGDGRKDSNEPGIGGITVSIYRDINGDNIKDTDAPFATTTSNTQGFYSFANLAPGKYIISIPVLAGYSPSPNSSTQATSPFPDNDIDNDNNGVNVIAGVVFTNSITLTIGGEPSDAGNTNNTFDIALCGNAFIGDFVWNDLNGNGIQETNEPGINGATVNLTFSDGTVATTTTANFNGKDGYYDFKNLGPDTYVVSFVTPTGLTPSPANQGSNDALDSDPVNGSVSVTLLANVSNFTIDAGFTTAGICALGNLLFLDLNYNGIRDLSEPGIPGATINLYRDSNGDNVPDGPAIATTTTITDGSYRFTRLTADSYIVGAVLPSASYAFLPNGNATPNNNIDNDNNGIRLVGNEVQTNFITLAPGTEPTTDGDDNNTNSTLDLAMRVNVVCRTPLIDNTNSFETVETGISVYPNPAVRNFNLSIKSDLQSFATIWIADQSGRVVFSRNQMLNKGSNVISLNADNRMSSGVYYIQSLVNGKLMTKRIVISK